LSNPYPWHFITHPPYTAYRLVRKKDDRLLLQSALFLWIEFSVGGEALLTGLPGCVIMGHRYRIVSIHKERLSTMRTLAWVIVLVVIAANEPSHLLKIIVEFISTLMHIIGP